MVKLHTKPVETTIMQVFAPTTECSDEEIDKFYDGIESVMKQCGSTDNTIIQGYFNAKTENGKYENIIGLYGLGTRNTRGQSMVERGSSNDSFIINIWFK